MKQHPVIVHGPGLTHFSCVEINRVPVNNRLDYCSTRKIVPVPLLQAVNGYQHPHAGQAAEAYVAQQIRSQSVCIRVSCMSDPTHKSLTNAGQVDLAPCKTALHLPQSSSQSNDVVARKPTVSGKNPVSEKSSSLNRPRDDRLIPVQSEPQRHEKLATLRSVNLPVPTAAHVPLAGLAARWLGQTDAGDEVDCTTARPTDP